MASPEEIKAIKTRFAEMTETPGAGHKLIDAARALRDLYRSLPDTRQVELAEWVRSFSDLDSFVCGTETSFYVQIAVRKKGVRRANFEHLERYTSEDIVVITGEEEEDNEYIFHIWKTEWRYVEGFLKEFEIPYRLMAQPQETH